MPYQTGSVTVGTTPTLVAASGAVPSNGGVRVRTTSSASVFLGGSAVTTATGFPISSTDAVVNVPSTGAASEPLFALVLTGTATVNYILAG
jgi:hypothetical protein